MLITKVIIKKIVKKRERDLKMVLVLSITHRKRDDDNTTFTGAIERESIA